MLEDFKKRLSATQILILATVFLASSACLGQSSRGDVITSIPFPFMVANHALPPGRYIVTPLGETNLRIYANQQSIIFQTHRVQGKAPEGIAKVVFHRYGDTYFLSEVWFAANGIGRQLFTSLGERELAKRTDRKIAVLRIEP